VSGFEPPTAGTQKIEIEQIQTLGEILASDDHERSAAISTDGCKAATDEDAFADVLLLPPPQLSALEHADKLAELANLMLGEGRIEPAKGVLRALRKVLANAGAAVVEEAAPIVLEAGGGGHARIVDARRSRVDHGRMANRAKGTSEPRPDLDAALATLTTSQRAIFDGDGRVLAADNGRILARVVPVAPARVGAVVRVELLDDEGRVIGNMPINQFERFWDQARGEDISFPSRTTV
jgi:hypothetical protein